MILQKDYYKLSPSLEIYMLYPDFNDLVACKDRKSTLLHPLNRSVKTIAPGNHHSPFRGQGLEFDSVREYVPGDDIRNIDWRVTARTGSPHLKLFKEERERPIIICIDMNAAMRFGTRKTFKSVQAARVAALLGWQGIAQQDRVSACLFGDVPNGIQYFAPKRSPKFFCSVLKMLAEPPAENHHIALENVLQHISPIAHTGSLVYLISDFMDIDSKHEKVLSRLNKRCDVVFIAVNDQADKSIYPVGTVGFCTNATERNYVNTESIAGRKAYADQWKENRKKLYEITSRLKVPMVELTTESDDNEILFGLKSIARRKKR
jgi:uncharacterized protein (DUF58 family)